MPGNPRAEKQSRRVSGISVIVTAHNGESWIENCLASILSQATDVPMEVIIVDDASSDDTRGRVRRLPDKRLRLVGLETNMGVSAARNRGLAEARHEWVAFNDQDDVWLPGKLERQVNLLEETPEAGACGGGNGRLAADGRSQWRFAPFGIPAWMPEDVPSDAHEPWYVPLRDGHIYLQSLIARTDLARKVAFDDALPLWEDWDFILRLSRLTPLVCVPEPVFLYRLGYHNLTAPRRMKAQEFLACEALVEQTIAHMEDEDSRPDTREFLENFVPDPAEVTRFEMGQAIRWVNTVWVDRGFLAAVLELVRLTLRRPRLTLAYVRGRLGI
jgi:glycosyltransferase involved in cell wall biosynthesis